MKKQSTAELAALLSKELADKPRRKARVLDLEGADEDVDAPSRDAAPPLREPATLREPPPSPAPAAPPEAPALRTGQPLQSEAPAPREPPAPRAAARVLPVDAAHLRLPYEVLDHELAKVEPMARAVLLRLYRLSAGFYSTTCQVSIPKLASHCKMGETKVRSCLRTLEADGYIRRVSMDLSNKNQSARGLVFEVYLPRMAPPSRGAGTPRTAPSRSEPPARREPNKEEQFKEKGINITPTREDIEEYERARAELSKGEGTEPR